MYIIVWVHVVNGRMFVFKNESMTVQILFIEYMIYNNTCGVISCVPCLRLYEPDVSSDVSGWGTVSYYSVTLQGNQYKLVTIIYSGCFVF